MTLNIEYQKELKTAKFTDEQQLKIKLISKLRKPSIEHYYNSMKQNIFELDGQFIEKNLRCKLCQDYFQKFTITFCGHSFCYLCIFEHLLKSHKCPCCFATIKGLQFVYCKTIDNFIQSQVIISSQKHIDNYYSRKQVLKEWKAKKKIYNFNIGDLIDVLDSEHIWCVGKILNIKQKKENQILIHYQGYNKVYDEYISMQSPRLSTLGLFTNRKDILLYQPSLNEDLLSNYLRYLEQLQSHQTSFINYLILQRQNQNQNLIFTFESTGRNTISNLFSLIIQNNSMFNDQQQ
ncbi:unnamed protein product [Paramecium sonneborni]|uniref:RING-type domain-containing protein n=1 Tax=Paramecium sonneborni TaxID=65129 RepID=A0A8S1L5Y6_9CILI|nr:unnamed protein product [Paramecium sonneborni]